jgi:hypothetical protein
VLISLKRSKKHGRVTDSMSIWINGEKEKHCIYLFLNPPWKQERHYISAPRHDMIDSISDRNLLQGQLLLFKFLTS